MKEKNDKKDFLGGSCSSFSKNNSKRGIGNAVMDIASCSQNIPIQNQESNLSEPQLNLNAMHNQQNAKVCL